MLLYGLNLPRRKVTVLRGNGFLAIWSGGVAANDAAATAFGGLEAERCTGHCNSGRGDMIRTCDPLLPKQMLYQAELRPDRAPRQARDTALERGGGQPSRFATGCNRMRRVATEIRYKLWI